MWCRSSLCSIENNCSSVSILHLLDPAGGWFARLTSIVLIPSRNYGALSLEWSEFSTGFSDVQPAFLELQGTENHLIAGFNGSLSWYKYIFISS